jgi:hypothetical protein
MTSIVELDGAKHEEIKPICEDQIRHVNYNRKTTVIEERKVNRLMYNSAVNDCIKLRCNVCRFTLKAEYAEEKYDDTYTKIKLQMDEHITSEHPDFCYKCEKCHALFILQKDEKEHYKLHRKQKSQKQKECTIVNGDVKVSSD